MSLGLVVAPTTAASTTTAPTTAVPTTVAATTTTIVELFDAMGEVDEYNQTRLGEIFDELGWPGWSLVGEDGSTAVWAIVQHADLAYLTDRARRAEAGLSTLAEYLDELMAFASPPTTA